MRITDKTSVWIHQAQMIPHSQIFQNNFSTFRTWAGSIVKYLCNAQPQWIVADRSAGGLHHGDISGDFSRVLPSWKSLDYMYQIATKNVIYTTWCHRNVYSSAFQKCNFISREAQDLHYKSHIQFIPVSEEGDISY